MKKILQLARTLKKYFLAIFCLLSLTGMSFSSSVEDDLTQVLNNTFSKDILSGPGDSLTVGGVALSTKLGAVHSILESGAACNAYGGSPTDDTTTLQIWFNGLPKGTMVTFPAGTFCLFDSADLQTPANVSFTGAGGFPGRVSMGANPTGAGLVHDPAHHLIFNSGQVWDGIIVSRYLGDGHFHQSPTAPQAVADVFEWWNEYSEGVTYPLSAGNVVLKNFAVVGFHVCIAQYTAQLNLQLVRTDCPTSVAGFGSGDGNYWQGVTNEPWYSGGLDPTTGAFQRYGASFYFSNGGNAWIAKGLQSEGWPMGIVTDSGAGDIYIADLVYEYPENWANGGGGIPAEASGVCAHLTGHNVNVVLPRLGCSAGGFAGVYSDAIDIDNNSPPINIMDATIGTVPVGGYEIYVAGSTAAPTVKTITAIPAVGQTVTVTVTGPSGGPYSISYVIETGDTIALVGSRLTYLLNTQWSALAHAHVNASWANPALSVFWPGDQSYSVSTTNLTVTTTTGSALPGSSLISTNLDLANANLGNITLGNSTTGALAVSFNGVFFAQTTIAASANWLSYTIAPQSLTLSAIQGFPSTNAFYHLYGSHGTFSWKPQPTSTIARIRGCGAGASGGGGAQAPVLVGAPGGGGGGGGGCFDQLILTANFTTAQTITVGQGGAAAPGAATSSTAGTPGNAGGPTCFGGSLIANAFICGGGGGGGAAGQPSAVVANGGGGGSINGNGGSTNTATAGTGGPFGGAAGGANANNPQAGGGGGASSAAGASSGAGYSVTGCPGGGGAGGLSATDASNNGAPGGSPGASYHGTNALGGTVGSPTGGSITPLNANTPGFGGGGGYGSATLGGNGGQGTQCAGSGGGGTVENGNTPGNAPAGADGWFEVTEQ